MEETRNNYENQIKEIKEENLENRIDLEAKIDEKEKMLQNLKTSEENKIEEMKLKIDELNNIIISYQNQEQELAKDKKNKKGSMMMKGGLSNLEGTIKEKCNELCKSIMDDLSNFDKDLKRVIQNDRTETNFFKVIQLLIFIFFFIVF